MKFERVGVPLHRDNYQTNTVNPEIFARNLFSRHALKDIFVTLKKRDKDLPISGNDRVISPFGARILFS